MISKVYLVWLIKKNTQIITHANWVGRLVQSKLFKLIYTIHFSLFIYYHFLKNKLIFENAIQREESST